MLNNPEPPGIEYIAHHEQYEKAILNGWTMDVVKYGNEIDRYVPAKLGQLTCIIGHTTVGKTTTLLWMLSKLMKAQRRILVYSAENRISTIHKALARFYTGKHEIGITELDEIREAVKYIEFRKHFTCHEILNQATYVLDAGFEFDFFLIDPYNALRMDPTSKVNGHEYHYQCVDEMRVFCLNTNKSIFLNCHTVTESQRVKPDSNGHKPAPLDSDVEGGAKFPNKADDTIVMHRQVHSNIPGEKYITEIHVRKVRNDEFGGGHTPWDNPIKVKFRIDRTGFDFMGSFEQKNNDYKQMAFKDSSF